ncbi:MAG: ribonuclease P protein component [Ignavibacteria bacterium]|nr:ribonuclease P protein component [Ignavibacteria bacterium]
MKKKIKKSTERNRLKRILRELYRLHKTELVNFSIQSKQKLRILFTLSNTAYKNHQEINFSIISSDMQELIIKILSKVTQKNN